MNARRELTGRRQRWRGPGGPAGAFALLSLGPCCFSQPPVAGMPCTKCHAAAGRCKFPLTTCPPSPIAALQLPCVCGGSPAWSAAGTHSGSPPAQQPIQQASLSTVQGGTTRAAQATSGLGSSLFRAAAPAAFFLGRPKAQRAAARCLLQRLLSGKAHEYRVARPLFRRRARVNTPAACAKLRGARARR